MTIKNNCEKINNLLNETFKDIKSISFTLYEYIHRLKVKIHDIEHWSDMYNKVKNYMNKSQDTDNIYLMNLAKLKIVELYLENNHLEKRTVDGNLDQYNCLMKYINELLKDLKIKEGYYQKEKSFEYTYGKQENEKVKEMHKTGLEEIKPLIDETIIENHGFLIKLKEEISDIKRNIYSIKCVKG